MGVLSLVVTVALAVTTSGARAALNTTSANSTIHSFADSCENHGVRQVGHDAWLSGYCRARDGSQLYSSLNLNHCIANAYGKMEARDDGNFAQTCDRMLIHGARPVLYAYCDNGHYPQDSVIDLGEVIDNDGSRLHCFGHYGE